MPHIIIPPNNIFYCPIIKMQVRLSNKAIDFMTSFRQYLNEQEISINGYFRHHRCIAPGKISRLEFYRMAEFVRQNGGNFRPLEVFMEFKRENQMINLEEFKTMYLKIAKGTTNKINISHNKPSQININTLTQSDLKKYCKTGFNKLLQYINTNHKNPLTLFKQFCPGRNKLNRQQFTALILRSQISQLKDRTVRNYLINQIFTRTKEDISIQVFRKLFLIEIKNKNQSKSNKISALHGSLEKNKGEFVTLTNSLQKIEKWKNNPESVFTAKQQRQVQKLKQNSKLQIYSIKRQSLSGSLEKHKTMKGFANIIKQKQKNNDFAQKIQLQRERIKQKQRIFELQLRNKKEKERQLKQIRQNQLKQKIIQQQKRRQLIIKQREQMSISQSQKLNAQSKIYQQGQTKTQYFYQKITMQNKEKQNKTIESNSITEQNKKQKIKKNNNIKDEKMTERSMSSFLMQTSKTQSKPIKFQQVQNPKLPLPKQYLQNSLKYYRKSVIDLIDMPYLKFLQDILQKSQTYIDTQNPQVLPQHKYMSTSNIFKNQPYFLIAPNQLQSQPTINVKNIRQGNLGNCYFISAISSIANKYPSLLSDLFLFDINPAHYYAVRLFVDGQWRVITTDDLLPSIYNQIACAKSSKEEIWVSILEKCFAKIFGSYSSIVSGNSAQAFQVLTGAPSETILLDKQDHSTIIKRAKQAESLGFLMTTSGNAHMASLSKQKLDILGLISDHMYSILGIYEIDEKILVKLRNPWGKNPWKGDWSFNSNKWTQKLRKQLNFQLDPEDGTFFMSWLDFSKYYAQICICHIHPTFLHTSFKMTTKKHKSTYLQITIQKKGKYNIYIHQQIQRKFRHQKYQYSDSRLILMKKNDKNMEYVCSSNTLSRQTCDVEGELQAGVYVASAKVNWQRWEEHDCFLTVYGVDYVKMKQINRQIAVEFKHKLLQSYSNVRDNLATKTNYDKFGQAGITKTSYLSLKQGIGFIKIANKSDKHFNSVFSFDYSNMKLIKPVSNPHTFDLQPGDQQCIGFMLNAKGYNYQQKQLIMIE